MVKQYVLKVYYFIGSVYFALILIALVALFVIAGTIFESYADSHLYAAQMVYNRPILLGFYGDFFSISCLPQLNAGRLK